MRSVGLCFVIVGCATATIVLERAVLAQTPAERARAEAAIVSADKAFNQSVADRNLPRFLALVADNATFAGGTPDEVHGRDAVATQWTPLFQKGGPILTWKPTKGEVLAGGELGYTVGSWERRAAGRGGAIATTRGTYLTVWRKQADGTWKAVYDTGGQER